MPKKKVAPIRTFLEEMEMQARAIRLGRGHKDEAAAVLCEHACKVVDLLFKLENEEGSLFQDLVDRFMEGASGADREILGGLTGERVARGLGKLFNKS